MSPTVCASSPLRRPALLGAGFALFLAVVPAAASDWTRFRGPNGLGTAETGALPSEFGPGKNVLWKTEIPSGHSSPVLGPNGRIYLTALQEEPEELLTIALDGETGKVLWQKVAPRSRHDELDPRNHPASPSPATDDEGVYVFFAEFGLLAYDHDGKERWRLPLDPYHNLYGMGASPVVAEDKIVLAADQQIGSYLLAVDRKTGKPAWRVERPEATSGHSTPVLYRPGPGPTQLLLPGSFFLTAYSVDDGAKLWWVRGLSFEMKSTPVLSGDTLYINGFGSEFNEIGQERTVAPFAEVLATSDADGDGRLGKEEQPDELSTTWFPFNDLDGDGSLDAREWTYYQSAMGTKNSIMAIRLPGAQEHGDLTATHVRWQYHRSVPQLPSPLLYRDVLYMINDRGIVTSFAPATGKVIAQGRIEGAVDSYYASPVAGDGKIFFAGRSGKVAVLPPGGALDPLAVNDLDDQIMATPAIADGKLLLRTRSALWAFGNPR